MILVELTGQSSKQSSLFRRLSAAAPNLEAKDVSSAGLARPARQVQRRLTRQQAEQLVTKYLSGASIAELSTTWQLHRSTVAMHLQRAGVQVRRRGLAADQISEAADLYEKGWPLVKLGERFNCDGETVRQALNRAGVQIRRPWERV